MCAFFSSPRYPTLVKPNTRFITPKKKVDAQHPLQTHRGTAAAGLGVEWLDLLSQLSPRHDLLDLSKKRRSPRPFGEALQPNARQRRLTHQTDPLVVKRP
jgi:hypothetical protein